MNPRNSQQVSLPFRRDWRWAFLLKQGASNCLLWNRLLSLTLLRWSCHQSCKIFSSFLNILTLLPVKNSFCRIMFPRIPFPTLFTFYDWQSHSNREKGMFHAVSGRERIGICMNVCNSLTRNMCRRGEGKGREGKRKGWEGERKVFMTSFLSSLDDFLFILSTSMTTPFMQIDSTLSLNCKISCSLGCVCCFVWLSVYFSYTDGFGHKTVIISCLLLSWLTVVRMLSAVLMVCF